MQYKQNRVLRWVCGALAATLLIATCVVALSDEPAAKVRVGALKGPTGMGVAPMMQNQADAYAFTLAGAPDEMVALLASGQVDIAALPINAAAALYNKTGGSVQLTALYAQGMLYVLEAGESVQTVQDLAGKTLYATGQGATPEYALAFILAQQQLADQVTVAFKTEHAELATLLAAGQVNLAMLPEPFVTSVRAKNPALRVALDITNEFNAAAQLAGQPDAVLSMGGWVVRKQFAQEHPEAVAAFLADYAASAAAVNADPASAALLVEQFGIVPSAAVAEQAIPNCRITCVTGADVKAQTEPLLNIWFAQNPAAVGGALPGADFFYEQP